MKNSIRTSFEQGFIQTSVRRTSTRTIVGSIEVLEGRALATAGIAQSLGVNLSTLPVKGSAHVSVHESGHEVRAKSLLNLAYLNDHGRVEHLDLYLPSGPKPEGGFPVILAIPGGGWRWVRRNDLGSTVSSFTKDGFAVAVTDYAFASSTVGTSVWPRNLLDVQQAVRWLRTNSGKYGFNPDKIAAWGESAGGNLAALLGTTSGAAGADRSAQVQAVIDFYGPAELTQLYQEAPGTRPYLVTFLGGTPSAYPARYLAASPAGHVTSNDPPFFILQGTSDTSVPPEQSASLLRALQGSGVPVKAEFLQGQPHGFRLNVGFDLRSEIVTFLRSTFDGHSVGSG